MNKFMAKHFFKIKRKNFIFREFLKIPAVNRLMIEFEKDNKSFIVYQDNDKLLKYSRQSNKADFALTYRVDFEEYKIKLLSSISGAGSPKINGADSVMIKMGDGIKIEPNASLADGYLFKEFEYKVNKTRELYKLSKQE